MITRDKLHAVGVDAGAIRPLGQAGARPLDELVLDRDLADAALAKLRDALSVTGLWPVIWGPDAPIDQYLDTFKRTQSDIERGLTAAKAIDPLEWLAARRTDRGIADPDDIGHWPTSIKRWGPNEHGCCGGTDGASPKQPPGSSSRGEGRPEHRI